jgi:hypothetical protein
MACINRIRNAECRRQNGTAIVFSFFWILTPYFWILEKTETIYD